MKQLIKNDKTNLCAQKLYARKNGRLFLRINSDKKKLVEKIVEEKNLDSIQEFFDRLLDWYLDKAAYMELNYKKKEVKFWKGNIENMPTNPNDF